MPKRVAITGSSGLIGSALRERLRARGDTVVALVRRTPEHPDEVGWDPHTRELDPAVLDGVDAVVNLAGAGVGDARWTAKYRRLIVDSRTDSTYAVARAIAATGRPVRLVSGSAVGYYGDRGEELLDEASAAGTGGFLSEVVRAWEASTKPAMDAGAPVAFARTGLVLDRRHGALARMLPLARLGLAGPLGSGRQWWPWISITDEARALVHLIDDVEVTGPVNLTAPNPARQKDIAAALGKVLRRPAFLPAPAIALRTVLGGFASDILASTRAVPTRLLESGFTFEHDDVTAALAELVTPRPS